MVSLERGASEVGSASEVPVSVPVPVPVPVSDVASMSVPVDASISLEEPMSGRVRTDPGTAVPAL